MTPEQRQQWVRDMGTRQAWWDLQREDVFEPDWEIVDPHCHLWVERQLRDPADPEKTVTTSRYMIEQLLAVQGRAHKLSCFMFVECGSGYRDGGPEHLRSAGETGFAERIANNLARDTSQPQLRTIIAHADLRHERLDEILDAHQQAGGGLFRGIRQSAAHMPKPADRLIAGAAAPDLYTEPNFRKGLRRLGARGLTFDAFQFHFQLTELVDLASAAPDTTIVVNHLGAPVGFAPENTVPDTVFNPWAEQIDRLAALPNTIMKLGGMASIVTGYDGHLRRKPPSSAQFVAERGPYFAYAIERFGANRCMFESNFPVDSTSISYEVLWNAYKRIAAGYDEQDRHAMLAGTASRIYGIG